MIENENNIDGKYLMAKLLQPFNKKIAPPVDIEQDEKFKFFKMQEDYDVTDSIPCNGWAEIARNFPEWHFNHILRQRGLIE